MARGWFARAVANRPFGCPAPVGENLMVQLPSARREGANMLCAAAMAAIGRLPLSVRAIAGHASDDPAPLHQAPDFLTQSSGMDLWRALSLPCVMSSN